MGGVEKSNREDFLTADEDSRLTGTDIQTQHPSELLGTRQKEIALPPPSSRTSDFLLLTTKQRD